ncbi:hypothetical protein M422DRAFT_24691 [Sphaerobolus stellatus SS14]|nr:hypothetical protein M422DRAFT_24691 [Sphaerobolus stellatus SS14]
MAALTANPQSAFSPPSWDESIVPTLRKRLENESRILSKRLSTISVSDDNARADPAQNGHRAVSPASNSTGEYHIPTQASVQRPSAIPRPSYSRERSNGSTSTQGRNGDSSRKPGAKRQRTLSTPFPFEDIATSSEPPLPSGGSVLAASTSASAQRVQSPPLGRTTPTPSRIPTVASRARSASQSSQSQRVLNNGKASLPASYKTAHEKASQSTETLPPSLKGKVSAISLSRQRIADEQRPFPSESSAKSIDEGRLSSDEEQPFQHWYRGDVARSGGVGEYKVGKRVEMLDIANYGHALGTSRRKRAYEEPIIRSENVVQPHARKRAESFSSIERTSIYMEPQDADRVLDETPLTDIDDETDYEHARYLSDPYARFIAASNGHQSDIPQSHYKSDSQDTTNQYPPSSRIPSPTAQLPTSQIPQPSRIPQSGRLRQSSISQPRSRSTSISQKPLSSTTPTSTPAGPSNGTQAANQRGRTKPAGNPSKTPVKSKSQKRSKSTGDALRSSTTTPQPLNTKDFDGLADAVPDTRTPIAKNGNWDDVILPTVARRMGIEYEMENPETAQKRRQAEAPIEPAPGTFGFDHSKYRPPRPSEDIPMAEFGQLPEPPKETEEEKPEPSLPQPEQPKLHRPRRDTLPSTPPFSDYVAPPAVPVLRERTDIPQVVQTGMRIPVAPQSSVVVEDERGAGCCKCVIM